MSEHGACPELAKWDPYDQRFRSDPFPSYAHFREKCPIGRVEAYGGFWAISTYEDVFAITRDVETFSSAQGVAIPPFPFKGRALPMESDPPEHDQLRTILVPDFTPRAVEAQEPMIRESARELISNFIAKGVADFSNDYAKVLPTRVICQLLDIDSLSGDFQVWAETIVYDRKSADAVVEAEANIRRYFATLLPLRKQAPGDDFISKLIKARVNGEPLPDDTILDFCWFLLVAGLDNTAFTIRNLLLQISNNPALRETLMREPARITDAIEETLRLYSPVWGIARTVTKDVDYKGRPFKAGDKLLLLYASADRDGDEFPNPDTFDLGRSPNRHMAFGMGRHRCLGSHLARMEIRIAIEEILDALPDYVVTEEVGWNEMGPLPVAFSARETEPPCE